MNPYTVSDVTGQHGNGIVDTLPSDLTRARD